MPSELPRRLFHLAGLFLLLVPYYFSETETRIIFLALALGEGLLEVFRLRSPKIGRLWLRWFAPLLRPGEEKKFSGSFFYLWGVALSFLFFDKSCAVSGLLVLAIADPVAGFFHARSRRTFLKKTLAGTLAFFFLSWALLGAFWGPWKALGAALSAAILENLSPLNDNFLLPLFVSAFLCLV